MNTKLNDQSTMPFGMHQGKMMQQVPAAYFHYLWTNGKKADFNCPVHKYIAERIKELESENEDLIWD